MERNQREEWVRGGAQALTIATPTTYRPPESNVKGTSMRSHQVASSSSSPPPPLDQLVPFPPLSSSSLAQTRAVRENVQSSTDKSFGARMMATSKVGVCVACFIPVLA